MPVPQVPPRMVWAVELMDPQPGDNILEIGCGPGHGAELICQRLSTGKLFAIDRSESGVDRTRRRNQRYVDAGVGLFLERHRPLVRRILGQAGGP